MVCKFMKMELGTAECTNPHLTEVAYCPFEDAMKKKAPQCCKGFKAKADKAYREQTGNGIAVTAVRAAARVMQFETSKVIRVTIENDRGDIVKTTMRYEQSTGGWKCSWIKARVDGCRVYKVFKDAMKALGPTYRGEVGHIL